MVRTRIFLLVLPILLGGAMPALAAPACALGADDRAWLDRSVRAWATAREAIVQAPPPPAMAAIVFDRRCAMSSASAMRTGRPDWTATPLTGPTIAIGEQQLPIGVMSATIGDAGGTRFVMSVPSVWAAGKVPPGPLGLDRLMTAVMMHEATHVFQMATYGQQIEALQKTNHLSDEAFNDDAIQARFGGDKAFADSIARETALFFAAAAAPDAAEARRLALAGRRLICERHGRYFVGNQAYQRRAEDLWLTMEGSGQWVGYRWLRLPLAAGGSGADAGDAMAGFGQRGKSWTQLLGLAIALTVDRIGPVDWKSRVFGDGQRTLIELLDDGLQSADSPCG